MFDISIALRIAGISLSVILIYSGGRLLIRGDYYMPGRLIHLDEATALLAGSLVLGAGLSLLLITLPILVPATPIVLALSFGLGMVGLWVILNEEEA